MLPVPLLRRAFGTSARVKPLTTGQQELNESRRHRIYSFGLTETGALGLHKPNEGRRWRKYLARPLRHQFAEERRVITAETGFGFTLFYVRSEGTDKVYGCGLNGDFQLGSADSTLVTYPTDIDLRLRSMHTKIVSLGAGRAHTAVATDLEGVFLLGSNKYGQCGREASETNDSTLAKCVITQLTSFDGEKCVAVHCGQDHTSFLSESGRVFATGCSTEGQTGLGRAERIDRPTAVGGDIEGERVVKLSGRADTVLAINDSGELFGWGSNEFKQLSPDVNVKAVDRPIRLDRVNEQCGGRIVDVAAGSSFCLVLNEHGDLFVWGYGILGLGPEMTRATIPTLVPRTLFGCNAYRPTARPVRLYAGLDHMAVVNSLHHVYTWGRNKSGCLGIGTSRDQFFPYKVAVGADAVHVSCAVDHSVIITEHN